jgi:hypothetical protein
MTKYMTEESECYMDNRGYMSLATLLDLESKGV